MSSLPLGVVCIIVLRRILLYTVDAQCYKVAILNTRIKGQRQHFFILSELHGPVHGRQYIEEDQEILHSFYVHVSFH